VQIPGAHRIEDDVASHLAQVRLALDQHRAVARLEYVATAAVDAIESLCVETVQLAHAGWQVGELRLDLEVVVVIEQAVGVEQPAEALEYTPKRLEEEQEVVLLEEAALAVVAARDQVVDRT